MKPEPWVSLEEIALHLGVSQDSIHRWIRKRSMPAHQISRLCKFNISEVDEWVRSGKVCQFTEQFHADELPTKAGIEKLDKLRFRDFLRDVYHRDYPDSPAALTRLLQNMNLATEKGKLNLAGVLLFAEQPEWIVPQFVIKAIRWP